MTWPLRARQEAHRALSARLSPSGRSGSRRLNSRDGRAGTVASATRQRAPTVPAGGRSVSAPGPPAPREEGARRTRLQVHRPSDRRGPGSEPGPQYAFKMSMFNVSCNSH